MRLFIQIRIHCLGCLRQLVCRGQGYEPPKQREGFPQWRQRSTHSGRYETFCLSESLWVLAIPKFLEITIIAKKIQNNNFLVFPIFPSCVCIFFCFLMVIFILKGHIFENFVEYFFTLID
ncbi:hypothetical protein EDEG_02634 [Edhazardia aedis USNM 41457]|uniref:Uncharacterized protein n=1 Tax=Edhazardia aedis (strain USNM 41457) TaxID=1003232 RepID=J9DK53_EDHAE|nr:hypothetical protein EDEG_02634 [Edhazardia aedis USNM 41457]|eukprot:EJW02990.1 hypothetical protein EDEG_02634 [Edhazardia aedis USNM 41457]